MPFVKLLLLNRVKKKVNVIIVKHPVIVGGLERNLALAKKKEGTEEVKGKLNDPPSLSLVFEGFCEAEDIGPRECVHVHAILSHLASPTKI